MALKKHFARKRFGQHWLRDSTVLKKIVEAADLRSGDRVLEVGPGRGALTEKLLASDVASVHAVEIDRDLVKGLRRRFAGQPRFSLEEGDVLKVPLIPVSGLPATKVVANIPYNITGPLLERLLGRLDRPPRDRYRLLILLLQKEVAERIRAVPGERSFSALSVRLQLMARCRRICTVSPDCFDPPPKVWSEIIAIEPFESERCLHPDLARQVESLLNKAFFSRRKMLRNTLVGVCSSKQLENLAEEVGIGLNQRPQEISPETWLQLARGLNRLATNNESMKGS